MSRFLGPLKAFTVRLSAALVTLGGPGLALLACLDSSFLPLPEVVDGSMMWLVVQHPDRWVYYAAMATAGSLGGCYVLYALARKGGHAFISKHLHESHIERGMVTFRKYGVLTVVVPSILPPPMPFKPFILFAGVADVSPGLFVAAIVTGRGFRYGVEALLAYWYGASAMAYVEANMRTVSLWFAGVVAVAGILTVLWRRRRAA
jgi:membrane protein YqaA with SNARE-associated domain